MYETTAVAKSGKVAGWMSPTVENEIWYPLSHFTPHLHARIKVRLCGDDWASMGKLDRHPENRRWMWYEWRSGLGDWAPLVPYRNPSAILIDSPNNRRSPREPIAWAPIGAWPGKLPEPLSRYRFVAASKPPAQEHLIPEGDGWPYYGLRLGDKTPPMSVRETEARILRGLRTQHAQRAVGNHARSIAGDWPAELYYVGVKMQAIEDAAEHRRNGTMETHVGDVRVHWVPTRRDQGDWYFALAWLLNVPRQLEEIIEMRAANPPYSFWQIGTELHCSAEIAGRRYSDAINRAHQQAIRR